jgi:hypothetical protein
LGSYCGEGEARHGSVDPGEQVDVVTQARPVGPYLIEADPVVRPHGVVDVEPTLLVRFVRVGEDLDHAGKASRLDHGRCTARGYPGNIAGRGVRVA